MSERVGRGGSRLTGLPAWPAWPPSGLTARDTGWLVGWLVILFFYSSPFPSNARRQIMHHVLRGEIGIRSALPAWLERACRDGNVHSTSPPEKHHREPPEPQRCTEKHYECPVQSSPVQSGHQFTPDMPATRRDGGQTTYPARREAPPPVSLICGRNRRGCGILITALDWGEGKGGREDFNSAVV